MFDVSEVPLGAESDGAETPTSLGMGLGQTLSEIRDLARWNILRTKNEQ